PNRARTRFSPEIAGLVAIGLAAALWAVAAVVADSLFSDGVEPFQLTEARVLIGMVGLGLGGGFRRSEHHIHPLKLLAFGLSIALVTATYYGAIDRLKVAVAIVLQYSAPVVVVAWTALVLRRRPEGRLLASLAASMLGVILVSGLVLGGTGEVDPIGVVLGLASALFFASYTLLGDEAGPAYGPVGAMFRAFAIASIFWIGIQAFAGWPHALFDPSNMPRIAFVGVAGTLVPFLLYVWGIQRVRAERAVIAATLEPVLAALVAWIFLNEALSAIQLAGGLLVIAAVIALQARRNAEHHELEAGL
ncbi:MAG: EamA family transporter, partial [Actinobacteria bacterium]|nr:EamA family transporter [Actinomycetota bacterium]